MNLEKQLLQKFQVEELEKRYEFAWVDEVDVKPSVVSEPDHQDPIGAPSVSGPALTVTIKF